MEVIPRLLAGNHPKAHKIKGRIVEIIRILKQNKGKIEATELERRLGVSRRDRPAMFYKPLHLLKQWDLVQVHRTVEFDDKGKKHFKTTYELTPSFFYRYIEKTLLEKVKTELEMV